jgi:hypothetical protein
MRYLIAALLCLACSAEAPSGAEDAGGDAAPVADAAADAGADAGDPYPLSWWRPQACGGRGSPGGVTPSQRDVCAAMPLVPPGTVEVWCDLRGIDESMPRTGLTPWAECIAWAIRVQSEVLPRRVPAWVADCAPPPPCQGVADHHCPGRAVHYGLQVQLWVGLAVVAERCWPAR